MPQKAVHVFLPVVLVEQSRSNYADGRVIFFPDKSDFRLCQQQLAYLFDCCFPTHRRSER